MVGFAVKESAVRGLKFLSDYERGWIECLIDGEGCLYFGFRRERQRLNSFVARIIIGNTSRLFLEKACSIVPAKIYNYRPMASVAHRRKQAYEIHWFGNALRAFLPQLSLTEKEPQRLLMLEALEILERRKKAQPQTGFSAEDTKRLIEIEAAFRRLNRRGR